jgi:hypothetical protein
MGVEEKTRQEAEEARQAVITKLYTGMVKLAISSPRDYEQLKKFEESLRGVNNL